MNTRLLGKKKEFAEILMVKDMKAAVELYENEDTNDSDRVDFIFISISLNFSKFLDYAFHSLCLFEKSEKNLIDLYRFAETKEHIALFFNEFKDVEVNNNGFLLDAAILAIHTDNIVALRQIIDGGYVEKNDYSFHDGISYTLLEYASTVRAHKCVVYLIANGFKANTPSQMKECCWAYPWPESVMLELENWKFFLQWQRERRDLITHQSLKLLWIEQYSPSLNVIKVGLTHLIVEDSFQLGEKDLKLAMDSVKTERIKVMIEELRLREFLSLSESEVLILVILGGYDPKDKKEEGVYLDSRDKFNLKSIQIKS